MKIKYKYIQLISMAAIVFIVSCGTNKPIHKLETDNYFISFNSEYNNRTPANANNSCLDNVVSFIEKPKGKSLKTASVVSAEMAEGPIRYPKGFEGIKGSQIQYGFESEYLPEQKEVILLNYMPDSSIYKKSKEDWLALSHKQREKFIEKNAEKIFGYRDKGKLVKIAEDAELNSALPSSFVYDGSNYEIVLDPMDSAEELVSRIKTINKHFGVGSMQIMISNPINKELLKKNKVAREQLKAEMLGYYNFMNDFDTLGKLVAGHERFLKDPEQLTVKSFNHPWLGPMTKLKHDKLEALVEGIIDQKKFSDDELKEISFLVTSHKFTGGLTFRPDVAYSKGRVASEVRDCHQNVKCIEDRIIRETYFLMKGKQSFTPFKDFNPFDSIEAFNRKLPMDVKNLLKEIFPIYGDFTQKELELFRNFSYPLRDWSKHVELLGNKDSLAQVELAQAEYVKRLRKIASQYNLQEINAELAQANVMGAIGEFAKNSGLMDLMRAKLKDLLDSNEIKNFDKLKFTLLIIKQNKLVGMIDWKFDFNQHELFFDKGQMA